MSRCLSWKLVPAASGAAEHCWSSSWARRWLNGLEGGGECVDCDIQGCGDVEREIVGWPFRGSGASRRSMWDGMRDGSAVTAFICSCFLVLSMSRALRAE